MVHSILNLIQWSGLTVFSATSLTVFLRCTSRSQTLHFVICAFFTQPFSEPKMTRIINVLNATIKKLNQLGQSNKLIHKSPVPSYSNWQISKHQLSS